MENDNLNTIWNTQNDSLQIDSPSKLIKRAKNQRKGQILSMAIMATTVVVLIAFTIYTKTDIIINISYA